VAHPSSKTLPAFYSPDPFQGQQEQETGIHHPTQDAARPSDPASFSVSDQKAPLVHMDPACKTMVDADDVPSGQQRPASQVPWIETWSKEIDVLLCCA